MADHPNDNLIERFFRRELAPETLLEVSEHLRDCAACRERAPFDANSVASSALRTAFETEETELLTHLEYADFQIYLENRAHPAEREIVESHVAVCAVCADELADLRVYRESLPIAPAPKIAAASEAAAVKPARQSFWSRFDFGFLQPTALAGAALLLFVAAGIYYFTGGWRNSFDAPQVSRAPESRAPEINAASAPIIETPIETPVAPSAAPPLVAANVAANVNAPIVETAEKDFLAGLTAAERQTVEQAVAAEKLPKADAADLRGGQSQLLGDGSDATEKISIQTPTGIVSRARRPVFQWRALPGAESYRVTVFDENFQTVAASDALIATRWQPAANLPPGKIYVWQIKAVKDGKEIVAPAPPAPEARFKVLDAATENSLQRLEKSKNASPLALGILYRRANLPNEARRAFQMAIRRNERPDLARKFLRQLK